MNEFLKETRIVGDRIMRNVSSLAHLADCFYVTGNAEVANRLSQNATSLTRAVARLEKAVRSESDRGLRQAEENSASVIKAALAWAKLLEEENDGS